MFSPTKPTSSLNFDILLFDISFSFHITNPESGSTMLRMALIVFSSIGYGYVKNIEFKTNLNKFGEGTAQYECDAIQQYVKEKEDRK